VPEELCAAMLENRGLEPYDNSNSDDCELYWQTWLPDVQTVIIRLHEIAKKDGNKEAVKFLARVKKEFDACSSSIFSQE